MKKYLPPFAVFAVLILPISTTAQEQPKQETPPVVAQASAAQQPVEAAAGNQEVLELLKAGMGPSIIIAKIKSSSFKFDTSPAALQALKAAGASDEVIVAAVEAGAPKKEIVNPSGKRRVTDELTTRFTELQTSVVTVWSEIGRGTGFIFDPAGLVMTNQHVVGPSEYVAVQFNDRLKVPARILATDPQRDVAVLWVNLASLPGATVAKIAVATDAEPTVVEGERVLTIGSPLNQRKIMTTGIASKIEPHAIISDININHGNSGGPLFNSVGEVIGITTFGDFSTRGGPGVSGIVRIEETNPVVELARAKMGQSDKPEARRLPVDPADKYPLDAIKGVVEAKKFDFKPYLFGMGDFTVALVTPPVNYRRQTEAEREAAKTKNKRNKNAEAVQGTFRPLDEFKNWAEYVGDYKPILIIHAQPNLGESFWGAVGRGVAANYGIHTQANLRFKTDFYRMKLFCGDKEVEPINPGKIFQLTSERNYFVKSNDATYAGFYSYSADAITDSCGTVRLQLFSEKKPDNPETKTLDKNTVAKIVADFQPYFSARRNSPQLNEPQGGAVDGARKTESTTDEKHEMRSVSLPLNSTPQPSEPSVLTEKRAPDERVAGSTSVNTVKSASVSEAINVLRALASTRESGSSYEGYSQRLAAAKPVVEKAFLELPQGELRDTVQSAMNACLDAGVAWEYMNKIDFMVDGQQVKPFVQKYPLMLVPISPGSPNKVYRRADVLRLIWQTAREQVERAARL